MRRRHIFGSTVLVMIILVITACHKEYFQLDKLSNEMEIEPRLVAPLIHGSMSMGDIVSLFDSAGYVDEFDDGLIYLAYSDTLVDLSMDTLNLLIDNYYSESYPSPEIDTNSVFIASGIGDTVHFLKSTYYSIETKGENRLDSVFFQGGDMLVEISSTFGHRGFLSISSSDIREPGGNDYANIIEITSTAGDFTGSVNHNLDGYSIKCSKQGDSSVFRVDYDLALINSGNPIIPGESCGINTSMLDLGFYSVFGYIDPAEIVSERGEQAIGIFSDYPALSHLKLADPRIDIRTESSLGVPFELTLDSVIATAEDMSTLTLEFYEGHPFKIAAPTLAQLGERVDGEYNINNQTSNFHELINLAPNSLSYRVTGGVDNDIADQNHFLLDTSRFMLEAEFLLPLDLKYTQYALEDTLEFELGDTEIDTSIIKNVKFNVSTVNELPIELDLQLYLLDEFHGIIDSVFEQDGVFLPASEVDANGLLQSASEQSNIADFPSEKLGRLENVAYILVAARLHTSDNGQQFVKFYTDYSLEFEISLHANFRINTQEL